MEQTRIIKRSGKAPIQFEGSLLFECNNYNKIAPMWHEINVFTQDQGGIVMVVKALKKHSGDPDIITTYKVEGGTELIHQLLQHNPKNDITSHLNLSEMQLSEFELALQGIALAQRGELVTKNWNAMIGDLLYDFYLKSTQL